MISRATRFINRYGRWVFAAALIAVLGLVFTAVKLPAGWLIAGMVGAAATAILSRRQLNPTAKAMAAAQGVIGVVAVEPLTKLSGSDLVHFAGCAAFSISITLGLSVVFGIVLARFAPDLGVATANLSLIAGGANRCCAPTRLARTPSTCSPAPTSRSARSQEGTVMTVNTDPSRFRHTATHLGDDEIGYDATGSESLDVSNEDADGATTDTAEAGSATEEPEDGPKSDGEAAKYHRELRDTEAERDRTGAAAPASAVGFGASRPDTSGDGQGTTTWSEVFIRAHNGLKAD